LSEDPARPLLQRARDGDADAFGELFRRFEPEVSRLCRRLLGAGAEDAAAEVFLRARAALQGYDLDRPFRRWLLAIASHHCIDQLRRRRTEARLFAASELEPDALADPGPSPLRHLARAEERSAVVAAIDALPDTYRLPLVLRYFNELDYDGIGEILGVTRGQVGTLLFRAKRRLRGILEGEGGSRS
jgi:RNA polymerase sigma-70 factor (ECF subfamily)